MEKNQRLFIYDRKEMWVLLLLGVMVAFFAFTLGVHLGKKVVVRPGSGAAALSAGHEATGVATTGDAVATKQEFQEQAKGANSQAVDETVNQALHEEIERTGLRLDQGKQIQLPSKTPTEAPLAEVATPARSAAPVHSKAHHYALQIGSYPTEADARARMLTISVNGLSPYVQAADVKGAKWHRVYVGSFASKDEAEKAGEKLKAEKMIEAFVISRIAKTAE